MGTVCSESSSATDKGVNCMITPNPRTFTRRFLVGVATALTAVIAMTGCASGTSAGSEGGEPVNFQLSWYKLGQFNGLFAADKEGYFQEEGIEPTFTPGGADILAWQQIVGGKALLGDEDNTLLLQAIEAGEPLVAIGTIFQKSPFAVMSDAKDPIESIEDFKGKTIAVPNNAIDQFTALVVDAGLSASDVEFVPGGSDPTQLITGQVDGYTGYATSQGASLELQGIKVNYLYLSDLGIPSYANLIVTTKDNVSKHKDKLVQYMTAAVKGYEYLADNGDAMAEHLVNSVNPAGGLDLESEKLANEIQLPIMKSANGYLSIDVEQMQKVIDALYAAGTLKTKLDAKDVVDTSILDAAYGGKTSLGN